MYQKGCGQAKHPILFVHEGILLPNGMQLAYDGLSGVPSAATSLGDDWTCEARADDGSDVSLWIADSTQVLPGAGDLVFSEFLADPLQVSDAAGEWVEIYNTSGGLLDLGGFELHDDGSDSHVSVYLLDG